MDDLGNPPTTARWLAWATSVVLVIGVVSAVVINLGERGPDQGFVSAAGRTAGTVEVPTTFQRVPPVQPSVPQSTIARSTTVPKAAAALLRAIASTAPPATQAATATTTPPTTRPPATTTSTTATTTSTTSTSTTTSTTAPPRAALTLVNEHPNEVVVTVNGQVFPLAAGQQLGPVDVTPAANGADVIKVRTAADATCGADYVEDLQAGARYRLVVQAGPATCGDIPAPRLTVTTL